MHVCLCDISIFKSAYKICSVSMKLLICKTEMIDFPFHFLWTSCFLTLSILWNLLPFSFSLLCRGLEVPYNQHSSRAVTEPWSPSHERIQEMTLEENDPLTHPPGEHNDCDSDPKCKQWKIYQIVQLSHTQITDSHSGK